MRRGVSDTPEPNQECFMKQSAFCIPVSCCSALSGRCAASIGLFSLNIMINACALKIKKK